MREQRVARTMPATKLAGSVKKLLAVSILVAISVAALLGQPARGAGNSYYVAPTGSDVNDGSSTAPFREIRRAVRFVQPGDTVYVADGAYLGFTVEDLIGTADAPVTFKAIGTNAVILPTSDRGDNRDNISVNDSAYLVFDGLNAFNAPRAGIRVNTCDHVTVRNGVFGNNALWGIFSGHADDLLIENNECFGSVIQHGIYTSNSGDRPTIRFNRIHDNASCGIHMNGDVSEPGDGLITGAVVEGNVIYNNGLVGHTGSGINMDGVQDSIVRNNLLYNNHNRGISCFVEDGAAGASGIRLLNNTISMAQDGFWAVNMIDTSGMNVIHNNILYHPNLAFGAIRCEGDADVANVDSDYNMLDRATPDGPTHMVLAEWQTLGKDLHSTTLADKALFVDPANGDFRLGAGAPAIDAGETLPDVIEDLAKTPRPSGSAYDIGSYEQPAGSTPPPPTPITLTATPDRAQVSLSWPVSTTATGYEVERKNPAGNFVIIAGTSTASYTDTGLQGGTTYTYRVRATNAVGNSGYSPESSALTPETEFSVSGTVTVGGVGVGGVRVAGGAVSTVTAADGTYTLTGFTPGNYGIYATAPNFTFPSQSALVGPSKTGVDFAAPAGTEIGLGGTYTVSGKVTINAIGAGGVLVAGGAWTTFTADDGTYTLSGFPAGAFGIYASAPGCVFPVRTATVGPSRTGVNFDFGSYSISGKVTVGGAGVGGVRVAGGAGATLTADDGTYTLSGFTEGNYGIYATAPGYTFPPQSAVVGPSRTDLDFAAPAGTDLGLGGTYTVSGTVTVGGVGVGGVLVAGGAGSTFTADDGTYTLSGFPAGSFGIYASKAGYTFPVLTATLGPSRTGVDFAGQ